MAYLSANDDNSALEDTVAGSKIFPRGNRDFYFIRAMAYQGLKKYDLMAVEVRKVLKLDPSNKTARTMLEAYEKYCSENRCN